MQKKRIILLAGPTASGKSALAIKLAHHLGGTIVNADSQQVYRHFRILTARPSAEEEAEAPHSLYGYVESTARFSTGQWLKDAIATIHRLHAEGRTPILTGGTGLNFRSLTQGLSTVPEIPEEALQAGIIRVKAEGIEPLYKEIALTDPAYAATLDAQNPQRVLRAWLVLTHTGQTLQAWHATQTTPPAFAPEHYLCLALIPPREQVYANCNARVHTMVDHGAVEEVKDLLALDLPPALPILRTHGVPEFSRYLNGETTLEEAKAHLQQTTRHYVKRQLTWLRHQQPAFTPITSYEEALRLL